MSQRTLIDRVISRVHGHGPGYVFTPKDFLDLGNRGSVGRVLSKLVDHGQIRRIARGLYDYPRVNERLGMAVGPDPNRVAQAIARQRGIRVTPSGAVAANLLGLTTQVPAKLVFLTDGDRKTIRVGKQIFVLKRVVPKDFAAEQSPAAMALRALKHLGKDAIYQATLDRVRQQLTAKDRREMLRRSAYMTDWLQAVARRIAAEGND